MCPRLAVLCVVMLVSTLSAFGQTEPGLQPPATQPAAGEPPATQPAAGEAPAAETGRRPATPAEILAGVEQILEALKAASAPEDRARAQALVLQAQRMLQAVDPRNAQAMVLKGELAMQVGQHNEGRTLFKAVLENDEYNFRANLGLGRFYVIARLWRQAGSYLLKAERVAPPHRRSQVLRLLAICYSGQRKHPEAVATAQQAVAADPTDLDSLELLVATLLKAGQYERAVETAKALVAAALEQWQAQPSDPSRLRRLMSAYETLSRTLRPYHNQLYRRGARNEILDELEPGNEAEAARVLSKLARISQETAKLQLELSYHQMLMLVERAVEYQPANTRYLLHLARLLELTHQQTRAIETYQRLAAVTVSTDEDPNQARQNQEAAEQALQRLGAPLTSQPAAESPSEP